MLKSEVIALLESIDGDPEVYVASDEEGNSFAHVSFVQLEQMHGEEENISPVHPSDIGVEYDADELTPAIVIWP